MAFNGAELMDMAERGLLAESGSRFGLLDGVGLEIIEELDGAGLDLGRSSNVVLLACFSRKRISV